MRFLDFEPVLALLLAIAPCIPAILAARLVQAEFEGLWKSHHARRALAACCSMLVVIFGEEWVFRLTMILTETVQGHGDFAQRLLDPSTPYAIIFPLMLELPSALYPWKSLGSRSGEISERLSRGISVFFAVFGMLDLWSWCLVFQHQKVGRSQGYLVVSFLLPLTTEYWALCLVQGAVGHLFAASANPIWKWNTGTLQKSRSSRIFIENATRCLRESFQSYLSEDGLGSIVIYSIQKGRWQMWRFFTDSLLQQ